MAAFSFLLSDTEVLGQLKGPNVFIKQKKGHAIEKVKFGLCAAR